MSAVAGGLEGTVRLKTGRDGPARAGHPWVFSGAIAEVTGAQEPGAFVRLVASDGTSLGAGLYNPRGSIAVRLVAREETPIDATLVHRRIEDALALRRGLGLVREDSAFRLLNGEGDWLPGVVIDVFAGYAVLQILNAGVERLRSALLEALGDVLAPRGIVERSGGGARREEGLAERSGVVAGEAPPERLLIREREARLLVDLQHGQKTGFYLDQRESRGLVQRLARGCRVLDAFAYTGAFSIAAALGGAEHVTCVETSGPALSLARESWAENGLDPSRVDWRAADVFDFFAPGGGESLPFDLIVLDPPPFARHRADRDRAVRAYRDLNRRALRALAPEGLLLTFSCSPHVSAEVFTHVVATSVARDERIQLLSRVGAPADHPTLPAHPEGEYLSGLLVRRPR